MRCLMRNYIRKNYSKNILINRRIYIVIWQWFYIYMENMTLESGRHYFLKLVANSWIHKLVSWSLIAFIGIISPTEYIIFHVLIWLWFVSMVVWTINGIINYGFNMRKFCMWWAKIIIYGVLIYFAKSLEIVTHMNIWIDIFSGFMIFELMLSIFKHCSELWIPMPIKLVNFVKKQEAEFERKYMNSWSEKQKEEQNIATEPEQTS